MIGIMGKMGSIRHCGLGPRFVALILTIAAVLVVSFQIYNYFTLVILNQRNRATMVMYRLIGNDMPPLQSSGQLMYNLDYTLKHEGNLPGVDKKWLLNRIHDPATLQTIVSTLKSKGYKDKDILIIPFEPAEYAQQDTEIDRLMYAIPQNAARNAAVDQGQQDGYIWTFMLDGNTFLTDDMWAALHRAAKEATVPLLKIPYHRVNRPQDVAWLHAHAKTSDILPYAPLKGESQVAFRIDATTRFPTDEDTKSENVLRNKRSRGYGMRNKSVLFKEGRQCGLDSKECACSDVPEGREGRDAEDGLLNTGTSYVERCGLVLRLWSFPPSDGLSDMMDDRLRGKKRQIAIRSMFARLRQHHQLRDQLAYPSLTYLLEQSQQPLPFNRYLTVFRPQSLQNARAAYQKGSIGPSLHRLLADADTSILNNHYHMSPLDKERVPPSGDKHDYFSVNPYMWLQQHPGCTMDTSNETCWERRDGIRVPGSVFEDEYNHFYDRTTWWHVVSNITALTLAGVITDKDTYTRAAITQTHTWFVDVDTRMSPRLTFSGWRAGSPSKSGVIDGKDLYILMDCFRLLESSMTSASNTDLRVWAKKLDIWLATDSVAVEEGKSLNNHGTYYLLQRLALMAYYGASVEEFKEETKKAEKLLQHAYRQEGFAPMELSRPSSLHYNHFTLQGWVHLADVVDTLPVLVSLYETKARICTGKEKPKTWAQCYLVDDEGGMVRTVQAANRKNPGCCYSLDDVSETPLLQAAMEFTMQYQPSGAYADWGAVVPPETPGVGMEWPLPMNEEFAMGRILPVLARYQEKYGSVAKVWALPDDRSMSSAYTVHSGIMPFWEQQFT